MKKLVCLFLMLWLPLSAGSAWAMSTQMQVNAALDMAAETAMDMPCHDMDAAGDDQGKGNTHCLKHNCAACGACFSTSMAGAPAGTAFAFAARPTQVTPAADNLPVSQTYPPALRPPIAS